MNFGTHMPDGERRKSVDIEVCRSKVKVTLSIHMFATRLSHLWCVTGICIFRFLMKFPASIFLIRFVPAVKISEIKRVKGNHKGPTVPLPSSFSKWVRVFGV